jgi:hypothetical protein
MHVGNTLLKGIDFPEMCNARRQINLLAMPRYGKSAANYRDFLASKTAGDFFCNLPWRNGSSFGQGSLWAAVAQLVQFSQQPQNSLPLFQYSNISAFSSADQTSG